MLVSTVVPTPEAVVDVVSGTVVVTDEVVLASLVGASAVLEIPDVLVVPEALDVPEVSDVPGPQAAMSIRPNTREDLAIHPGYEDLAVRTRPP
jgi:hypothetical protein